jgi:diphosphomevalonate decarboxylase
MSSGFVKWSSPSNIAIVKYWGKYGNQLPRNPSISFTLSESKSVTSINFTKHKNGGNILKFDFEGKENAKFAEKTKLFFDKLSKDLPWILEYDYEISSENTFPHSSGIASSASGMSALVMCLLDIGKSEGHYLKLGVEHEKDASHLSRLGSGSACRSVLPVMAVWGEHALYEGSSNLFAVGVKDEIHPIFTTYHNDILIVSRTEKSVSSSAGHQLMDTNPYAETRYKQANQHLSDIKAILQSGDIDEFGRIAENEALVLHALMMASNPSYILLEPSSLEVIKKIRTFREDTKMPIYFTIDAGPNIHVLYPAEIKERVQNFIQSDLKKLCSDGMIIQDRVGMGPKKII